MSDVPPVAIRTEELAKRYGKITALAGLTMSIPAGDVFGFLGPNGAGKTTAVKLLLGLARPSSGEGWVLGAPLSDRTAHRRARRGVGYLPELFRYQHWLSAREVLRVHCELIGLDRAAWDAEIKDALDVVGLADRADDRVGGYSKGMQQRLGLGVALLGRPALVLLDEPTSALDPVGRHDVREIIRVLKARGTTVFLNSHLLTEVERVCDRVLFLDHGRLTRDETLQGAAASRRRTAVRVSADRLDDAVRVLAEAGVAAEPVGDGVLRLSDSSDVQVSAAVKALALADVAVLEVRASAELEELFREKESLPS